MSDEGTGKTIYFTPDPENPPVIEAERLKRLLAMRDDEIDLSGIPDMGARTGWRKRYPTARETGPNRNVSREVEAFLEADVLEFFRERDEATPKRINEVLREYAEAHRKSA